MKRMSSLALLAVAALAASSLLAKADSTPIYLKISSPDRPQTWVAGAHQQSAKVRWDAASQMLVADVQYSDADYADSVHPAQTDYHTLAFPTVRLAGNGLDLLASNRSGQTATIGRLENGLFGKEVVLSKGVDLNVHRIDGKIHASLVYNALAER